MWNVDSVFIDLIVVSNKGLIPKSSINNLKKFSFGCCIKGYTYCNSIEPVVQVRMFCQEVPRSGALNTGGLGAYNWWFIFFRNLLV